MITEKEIIEILEKHQEIIDTYYQRHEAIDSENYKLVARDIVKKLNTSVVTNRTCYTCKYCLYESKKSKHEQFTCLGTIDLNHITNPHNHVCKRWDE